MANPTTQELTKTTRDDRLATRGRFVWHELMTKDPKAALTFYKQVVGWTTQKWQGSGTTTDVDYTMFMAGETAVGGVMPIPPEAAAMQVGPSWLAYIAVPDVDLTVDQVTKLGGGVHAPARTMPDVGRFAVLHDPQGATFAVISGEGKVTEETEPKRFEFSWHELVTTDYKAASKFYFSLFGWDKKREVDIGAMGTYFVFGRDRFTYGGMFNKPTNLTVPPHWLNYVQVESADAAAERATKAGGKVINGPMEVPGGDRIAQIVDPQGATFAVQSKK
jgi:predicted enzyme related to lactoylglutathione lyase